MTGNLVLLGFAASGAAGLPLLRSASALLAFVAGAVLAGRVVRLADVRATWPLPVTACICASALLAGVFGWWMAQGRAPNPDCSPPCSHWPWASRGAATRELGVADLPTTVVTSTLTGLAADSLLVGGPSVRWRRRAGAVASLLLGAVVGGVLVKVDPPEGEYTRLDPNDHVNLSQSTNDVYPTAVNVATIMALRDLLAAMEQLREAFAVKAAEFRDVVKMGRTQLQDAVPMTLGQEFNTYAVTLAEDAQRLAEASLLMHKINLGATAIGTGLNAPSQYAASACRHLSTMPGLPLVTVFDLIEATQDVGAFVHISGVLKRVAVKLSKTCNDLRLLSSGPRASVGEINLPPVQAGSSIMPGKINPVIPEVVNQLAYEVIGNDVTITMAAEFGQLQLPAFEPIIVHSLTKSLELVTAACRTLETRCIRGITANAERLQESVEHSIGLATALNPHIGYAAASEIARASQQSGRGVAEIVLERGFLTSEELRRLLEPKRLANLRVEPSPVSPGDQIATSTTDDRE